MQCLKILINKMKYASKTYHSLDLLLLANWLKAVCALVLPKLPPPGAKFSTSAKCVVAAAAIDELAEGPALVGVVDEGCWVITPGGVVLEGANGGRAALEDAPVGWRCEGSAVVGVVLSGPPLFKLETRIVRFCLNQRWKIYLWVAFRTHPFPTLRILVVRLQFRTLYSRIGQCCVRHKFW